MPRSAGIRFVTTSALVLAFFSLVALLQWTGGAYQAEFGAYPDEAAHYVTGLMVRDYLAAGLPGNPMAFAQTYYEHYPKVALGNWPPMYYVIQAPWTLLFSPGRASVLLLMALLTALTAAIVTRAVADDFGPPAGLLAGLLVLAFPLIQQYSSMMMTEIPVALFTLLAMLAFGRYLERGGARDSIAFGLFAAVAILTKGTGLALALMVPFAILISGRYRIVRERAFWYAAVIVLVLAGPWTWYFRDVARAGWEEPTLTADYVWRAILRFPRALARASHILVTLLAATGFAATIVAVRRGRLPARWAAPPALVAAVLVFLLLVPASLDVRHLVQALPVWAMLATAAVVLLFRMLSGRARYVPVALAVTGLVLTAWPFARKTGAGTAAVVEEIVKAPGNENAIFLISSDAPVEGMFIAEIAMRERRPGHIVRRASKLLASQRWHGGDYALRVGRVPDLVALLRKHRIRFVVIDRTVPELMVVPHHELLAAAVETARDDFVLRRTFPLTRGYPRYMRNRVFDHGLAVYELTAR